MANRYQSNPGYVHWLAVKNLRGFSDIFPGYLSGTPDLVLCYHYQRGRLRLKGYSDANWASDRDEHKSTTAYTFLLGRAAISWFSKKQSCIAQSTMESEYVACSAAVQEAVWLKRFLQGR